MLTVYSPCCWGFSWQKAVIFFPSDHGNCGCHVTFVGICLPWVDKATVKLWSVFHYIVKYSRVKQKKRKQNKLAVRGSAAGTINIIFLT